MDSLDAAEKLTLVLGGVAVGAAVATLLGGSAGAAKKNTGGRDKVRPLPPPHVRRWSQVGFATESLASYSNRL